MNGHEPVLLDEVQSFLVRAIPTEGRVSACFHPVILDGTLGGGGHAEMLLESQSEAFLVGLDRDAEAVTRVSSKLSRFSHRSAMLHGDFRHSRALAQEAQGQVQWHDAPLFHSVLLDLGFSSLQMDDPQRGFSFGSDAPLDMRLDRSQQLSADTVVNEYPLPELRRVLLVGGLRSGADALARAIIAERPVHSGKTLAAICERVLRPYGRGSEPQRAHPATVPFQAIRIAVNDEFGALDAIFQDALSLLASRGRLAVISFHSLEDQIVARTMRDWEQQGVLAGLGQVGTGLGRLLTKKAVTPSDQELQRNPRARSARLRVFEAAEEEGSGR